MKFIPKRLFTTFSLFSVFIFNACSSHDVVSISETHHYNNNFGLVENLDADALIQQEYLAMNQPTQIDIPHITDPEVSTDLNIDPNSFLAEEYVQTEPIITYKHKFDPKFYSKAEWKTMNLQ